MNVCPVLLLILIHSPTTPILFSLKHSTDSKYISSNLSTFQHKFEVKQLSMCVNHETLTDPSTCVPGNSFTRTHFLLTTSNFSTYNRYKCVTLSIYKTIPVNSQFYKLNTIINLILLIKLYSKLSETNSLQQTSKFKCPHVCCSCS